MSGKLKFAVESRAFAECLRLEHEATGRLLEEMESGEGVGCFSDSFVELRKAHEAVAHQKLRVAAAHGVRRG